VVGAPNFSETQPIKCASAWPSHRHQVPHCAQLRLCSCGPLLEPMVATWLPQRQLRGIRTFRPMIGEFEDGDGDVGGDEDLEDPKKSNCCTVHSLD